MEERLDLRARVVFRIGFYNVNLTLYIRIHSAEHFNKQLSCVSYEMYFLHYFISLLSSTTGSSSLSSPISTETRKSQRKA